MCPCFKGHFRCPHRGVHPRTRCPKRPRVAVRYCLMTPALLGKKVGMTRVYDEKGTIVPVTVVEAEPNVITQVKTADGKDGYNAVQLGFREVKAKYSTFPLIAHAAKAGHAPRRHFAEIRLKDATDRKLGD